MVDVQGTKKYAVDNQWTTNLPDVHCQPYHVEVQLEQNIRHEFSAKNIGPNVLPQNDYQTIRLTVNR